MNLTNFLKQTDTITAQYSAEQLRSFIHGFGRTLPEYNREEFLRRLRATENTSTTEDVNDSDFHEIYKRIEKNLKAIDSQEVTVTSILNEEYNDWYNDSDEEFYYEDKDGISDMITEACDFVHTCMDTENYKEGFEIGNQMFSMEILCENEYYGSAEFSLGDMVYHKLVDRELDHVLLDTAYCAYRAVPLEKRAEALYSVITNAQRDDITLEAIMQHGDEELPDLQNFLTLWITFLGSHIGCDADRLIAEAVALLNDIPSAAVYAEKYAAMHPGLYWGIMENGKLTDGNDMVSMGIKAMRIIPKQYIMRSRIALKTAEYIIEANENMSFLEKCYFAAYESDTSALNYIRALLNGYGTEEKRGELRKVFMPFPVHKNEGYYDMYGANLSNSERKENKPDSSTILFLRFLDGQFANVLENGLNKKEALGWSGSFMKQGIALYLLYLYEGEWTSEGIHAMADIAKTTMHFSEEEYQKGMDARNSTGEGNLFYELFMKWKSMMQMEPDTKTRALKRIEKLLEKRTRGIMDANRRNYYGECAAFIAALGEVQESLGKPNAKQRLMTSYKDTYPRRNAFRAAMRDYGWIDVRRKRKG